ncbi:hypothetical protein ASF72_01555 [Arthrobacter sp. Leaf141]|uniref:hypothetical protein n=1 Tax=Arthrobacter sp. Leaf141 TaxID=1736273 RepID=UPI0006F8D62C|nr:hypothetical protein [Arthrobacter sp. Leaf141]KQQ96373.1 hypothetical protein ASF72_01555 [Arthrobacter sp. Leaf141]
MRELLMVAFGLFFVGGCVATFLWIRTVERRTSQLGWTDSRPAFGQRRLIQFALCVAAAAGIYWLAVYGPLRILGAAEASAAGLVAVLLSAVWFIFRRDIAQYQYQIVMTMFNRNRPEEGEAQRQIKAMEALGIGFCILFFSAGILLIALSIAFS